jgi:hypothetical protein
LRHLFFPPVGRADSACPISARFGFDRARSQTARLKTNHGTKMAVARPIPLAESVLMERRRRRLGWFQPDCSQTEVKCQLTELTH